MAGQHRYCIMRRRDHGLEWLSAVTAAICLLASVFSTPMSVSAFQQPMTPLGRNNAMLISKQSQHHPFASRSSPRSSSALSMAGRMPEIYEWYVLSNGSITGRARYHPFIENGEDITTSPLSDFTVLENNNKRPVSVTTKSNSEYKLIGGNTKPLPKSVQQKIEVQRKRDESAKKKIEKSKSMSVNGAAPKTSGFSLFGGGQSTGATVPLTAAKKKKNGGTATKQIPALSGITIGDESYALAGKAARSTSGKSQIYKAYRIGADGEPVFGNPVTSPPFVVKLSSNYDSLDVECDNYNKVVSGVVRGAFVQKLAYYPYECQSNTPRIDQQSALVVQAGTMDLKEYIVKVKKNRGTSGKAMRDVAAAAGQCIQAFHSSKLVWTDLKTENFVVLGDPPKNDDDVGLTVRGIDLESARPFGDNPVDYSPEAIPPEFAEAYLDGEGPYFVLEPSYDIWSLGMLMYEVSTGRPYFDKKSGTIICTTLRLPDFEADVSAVEDAKLRDLIGKCLQRDPSKRPNIAQFLLHPFFTTTGLGPWSF